MKKNAFLSILVCVCMVLGLVLVPAVRANAATYECGTVADIDGYVLPAADGYNNYHFTATEAGVVSITPDGYASIENYTTGADWCQVWAGETATVTVAAGDIVRVQTYYSEAPTTLAATFTPAGGSEGGEGGEEEDVIDTSVLDGIYNVNWIMDGIYVLTFNNGTLTIQDNNNGKASGSYSYTVDADGNVTVASEIDIVIGKTADGYTFSCKYLPTAQPLVKVGNVEVEEPEQPEEPEISYEEVAVNTGNAITIDASWKPVTYQYTATEAGTFTVTVGMAIMTGALELSVKGDEASLISSALNAGEVVSIEVEADDVVIINFTAGYLLAGFTFEAAEGGNEGGDVGGDEGDDEGGNEGGFISGDGSSWDPFVMGALESIEFLSPAGETTDLYYAWTATEAGIVTIYLSNEEVSIMVEIMDNYNAYPNYNDDGSLSIFINEGETLKVNLYTYNQDEEVAGTASFTFEAGYPIGSEQNPATGDPTVGVQMEINPGATYYFTWTPAATETLKFEFIAAGWSGPSAIIINGEYYEFNDLGYTVINVEAGVELLVGVVGGRWGSVGGTLLAGPMGELGTANNPEILDSLENVVVDHEEGDYYYMYTVQDEGDLVITIVGNAASVTVSDTWETYTAVDGVITVPVTWDTTLTIVVGADVESFSGEVVYPLGSESNPIVWEELPTEFFLEMYSETYFQFTATESVDVYFDLNGGYGYWYSDNYALKSVYVDGETVGYKITIMAGETVLIYTNGGPDGINATVTVTPYQAPVGTVGNPEVLESIETIVLNPISGSTNVKEYYAMWTAPSAGTVTFTYANVTGYGYNPMVVITNAAGEEFVLDTKGQVVEIAVAEGEILTICASCLTWDMTMTLNGVFAGEHTEHVFGEWETSKEATCTENGEEIRHCECGETETRVVEATGHNYVDGVCGCGAEDPNYQPEINPGTGDSVMMFVILATVSMMGLAVVVSKKKVF